MNPGPRLILLVVCLAVAGLAGGCRGLGPELPTGPAAGGATAAPAEPVPAPGPSAAVGADAATAAAPAVAANTAIPTWCPDLDRDDWSQSAGCNLQDCEELRNFADPVTGWCPQAADLVCDPPAEVLAGDFAMVMDGVPGQGGTMHVIYIEGPLWTWYPATHGKSFGHEVTADGLSWQLLPDALTNNPASDWDRDHVWAPSIVRNPADGLWWMFYAGVTTNPVTGLHEERIGAATSGDLVNWQRVTVGGCAGIAGPGCLMDANWDWSAWDQVHQWARQCRDPFVIADPATGAWYMAYTAAPGPFAWKQVIALARSEDLVHWTDLGPLEFTEAAKAESPTLLLRDGRVHLFWTVGDDGGIGHASAAGFETGDWGPTTVIAGSAAGLQVAPEILDMGPWLLLGYVKETLRDLRFRALRMHEDGLLEELPIAPLGCPWVGAANVHPGAVESPNGVDDNCNGLVDEPSGPCPDGDGDLFGAPGGAFCSRLATDCDDTDPTINPGALELCGNGRDDDCDGVVDDPETCSPRLGGPLRAVY